jgi:hypothetical protein
MRARTSASQACGSMSFIFAVTIRLYITAARLPPRSEPQNSHDFRPKAIPRTPRSAALLKGMMLTAPLVDPKVNTIRSGYRDRGAGSTKWRQAVLTMSCELELLCGRPYDLPGCAASAYP